MHRASPTLRATITINRLLPCHQDPRPALAHRHTQASSVSQAHASPPSLSRLDSCGPGTRAPPQCFPRLARRGLTFRSADVQACCLPSCFCFIARTATSSLSLSPSAHPRSLLPLPLLLSLVPRPLACLPSGSPVAPPVSAGLCFSPTAIWDLKCLLACFPSFARASSPPLS
jgi:hypothetical protein